MISKIAKNIWKINADSNVYLLDFEDKIIIDTGNRAKRHILKQFLSKLVDFDKVGIVIFTHLHYDHIGNFDLFSNATLYASKKEINNLSKNAIDTVLNEDMAKKFKNAKVEEIPKKISKLEIIETPGHTSGSICVWYDEEKILFSGDTLFDRKITGRTDLPTSQSDKMRESLMKLVNYNFKILCPGHDY
ncbi:MBL fold metallo-hydrolase [Candidatus Woesearchaeota archaeon]|nr:MBL fold metallo-hydrolase [Candidatus Woesearchaeota archaeon]